MELAPVSCLAAKAGVASSLAGTSVEPSMLVDAARDQPSFTLKSADESAVQPTKAELPIVTVFAGMTMLPSMEQLKNE